MQNNDKKKEVQLDPRVDGLTSRVDTLVTDVTTLKIDVSVLKADVSAESRRGEARCGSRADSNGAQRVP
jgi:hypothetical protein